MYYLESCEKCGRHGSVADKDGDKICKLCKETKKVKKDEEKENTEE